MDYEVKIPYSAVESGDILLLQKEFNLPATSGDSVHILQRELKHDWLEKFLAMKPNEIKDFAEESGAHAGALDAFHRRMSLLCSRCSTFLMKKADVDRNAVEDILGFLQSGKNVVLEFGGQNHPGQYMLVANILSRRIHDMYVKLVEEAENGNKSKPPQLIITIEEAHKFLAPGMADQTIFGTIARELRKYRVTLLIVDQRPSGIDDEVLSQVGTKICCLLDDDRDISAVLTGTLGASGLKSVLTSLDSKQQAIIFGHAVPMPVVVRTRTYGDNDFRDRMGHRELTSEQRQMAHQKLKDESY